MKNIDDQIEDMCAAVWDELREVRERAERHAFPIDGAVRDREEPKLYRCTKGRRAWIPMNHGDHVELLFEDGRSLLAEFDAQTLDTLDVRVVRDVGPVLPAGQVVTDLSWILEELLRSLDKAEDPGSMARALIDPAAPEAGGIAPPLRIAADHLNAEQQLAIRHALASGITMLWGPPGAGKSTELAHLVLEGLAQRKSILIVAPTNAAVDHLALTIDDLLHDEPDLLDDLVVRLGAVSDPELRRRHEENRRRKALGEDPAHAIVVWPGPVTGLARRRLQQASVVVTTLPRCWIGGGLGRRFDLVVIDEASVVTIPAAFQAAKHAVRSLVVAGDYRQLGPIVHSRSGPARRWLQRDLWDLHCIPAAVERDEEPDHLVVLPEQHRMGQEIMEVVSDLWYAGRLRAAPTCPTSPPGHPLLGEHPLVVIDTSGCRLTGKRRFENGFHAGVAAGLGQSLACSPWTVGIITRHRDQARAISHALGSAKRRQGIRVDTVHSYQGKEADTVIIDVTAMPGLWGGDWIMARIPRSAGDRLLCVAASRARSRLVVLANLEYLMSTAPQGGTVLTTLLRRMMQAGVVIPATAVLDALARRAA